MKTAHFVTFGCKVNQYDTQELRERLLERGLAEVPDPARADLVVINSCTVTERGAADARRAVRRAVRANPAARVVVTGCAAEERPDFFRALPGVAQVIGNADKTRLARLVLGDPDGPPATGAPASFGGGIRRFEGRSRAFLKVQDGCDLKCSVCIIPAVRGTVRSRAPAEVLDEARRLLDAGYRELVLTGVHLGGYGREPGAPAGLATLVRALDALPGDFRLRLSSIEADELRPPLLDALAACERVSPHLHVPLQSGDDGVLRAMRRRYLSAAFLETIERIRRAWRDPAITTDVLAGVPGEDEPAFARTLEVCRASGFSKIHVFPYSPRRGTPAAELPGQVPERTKRDRVRRLAALEAALAGAFRARFAGAAGEVLVEDRRDRETGLLTGFTERYLRCFFAGPDRLRGALLPVRIGAPHPRGALAEVLVA
jgi:threonylcarbamoyladenosine tRNA methylthiotransferase MtaB